MLPAAARANRAVFYNRDGSARSFAEIRSHFAERMGGGAAASPVRTADARPTPGFDLAALDLDPRESDPLADNVFNIDAALGAGRSRTGAPAPSPQLARMAYMMLARLGG
jgi:hypothetical protein